MAKFVFSLIQLTPKAAGRERVNFAVVAGSEATGEWEVRTVRNSLRVHQLGGPAALAAGTSFVGALTDEFFNPGLEEGVDELPPGEFRSGLLVVDDAAPLSEGWLRSISKRMSGAVRVTAPLPIISDTIETAITTIFDLLMVDPEPRTRAGTARSTAQASVRLAYGRCGLAAHARRRARLVTRGQQHLELDFAIAGARLVQATHTFSFDRGPTATSLPPSVRDWAYVIQSARRLGGEIRFDGDRETFPFSPDVEVAAVYIPPQDAAQAPILEEAQRVFRDVSARAVSYDDRGALDEMARSAREGVFA